MCFSHPSPSPAERVVLDQVPDLVRAPFYSPRQYMLLLMDVGGMDITPEPYITMLEQALFADFVIPRCVCACLLPPSLPPSAANPPTLLQVQA